MCPRPALAPGLRVLDRGRSRVQIGIARHRLHLDADPGMLRVLAALDRGEAVPTDPRSRRAVERLRPVLVQADQLAPTGPAAADVAALALRDRIGFSQTLRRRRATTVLVRDELAGPVDPASLLTSAGFRSEPADSPGPPPGAALLLVAGEPDRDVLDPWVRDGVPHLVVRAVEGDLLVGPLVVPGETACLRCIDGHHGADDPLYPVLVSRHHRAARRDGVAEPIDSSLAAIAIGWAVRDLTAFLDGEQATSWSSTVRLGQEAGEVSIVTWLRDPACGCAWISGSEGSDTMDS